MGFILVIAAAILLYHSHPALFAWNATGFTTLAVAASVVLWLTFRKR